MLIKMQRRLNLKILAWIAWAVVGVEAVADLLEPQVYHAVIAAAVALSIVSATRSHAERLEAATREYANSITQHTLALNQVFELGLLSDSAARQDAIELHRNGHDAGGFKIHRGRFR